MKTARYILFLTAIIMMVFGMTSCEGQSPIGDDDQIDSDDDSSADDDDDNDDDSQGVSLPKYVRPGLPINAYYMAASHNTFIWRGPVGGPTTFVSSLGLIHALDFGQLFLEIDVQVVLDDGDFLVNHSNTTQNVRLSSMLRNVRWWSDTHPDHEMVVIGFQWSVGSDAENVANLNLLLDEILVAPSPLTETGPLYSRDQWVLDLTKNLDGDVTVDLLDLLPRELALVLGYPSIREMRGKVVLETTGSIHNDTPSFFMLGDDGQFENRSEDNLADVAAHTQNRVDQRLTRIYAQGAYNGNFNLFDGFKYGVSNSALNMEWVNEKSRAVFAFMDEWAKGYAPVGYMETVDGVPPRLGPPVFVAVFSAITEIEIEFDLSFDSAMGLENALVVIYRAVVQGLSNEEFQSIEFTSQNGVMLKAKGVNPHTVVFALTAGSTNDKLKVKTGGDEKGYEIHFSGPVVSDVTMADDLAMPSNSIWISPSFTPINLLSTGRCSTLVPTGARILGAYNGERCDSSQNPSFVVEMIGEK